MTSGTTVLGRVDLDALAATLVHILTPSAAVRWVVNMIALAVTNANANR